MFIADDSSLTIKLRRSDMLLAREHVAPTELNCINYPSTINILLLTEPSKGPCSPSNENI